MLVGFSCADGNPRPTIPAPRPACSRQLPWPGLEPWFQWQNFKLGLLYAATSSHCFPFPFSLCKLQHGVSETRAG